MPAPSWALGVPEAQPHWGMAAYKALDCDSQAGLAQVPTSPVHWWMLVFAWRLPAQVVTSKTYSLPGKRLPKL